MSWETFTRTKEFSEALKSVNARPLRFVTHGDEKEWKLNTVTGEFTSPIALDGRIVSMKDLGIDRPVLLPHALETGTYTCAFSGKTKPISYYLTFSECVITRDGGDVHVSDIITTNHQFLNMEKMFYGSVFEDFYVSLMITRSWLNAKGLFRGSKQLSHVYFDECKFTAIDNIFFESDVETVKFEECSLDENFNMYTQLSTLFGVFGGKIKRIELNNCDENLVAAIMYLYRQYDYTDCDFEIEIVE